MSRVCGGTSSAIAVASSTPTAARAVRRIDPQDSSAGPATTGYDRPAARIAIGNATASRMNLPAAHSEVTQATASLRVPPSVASRPIFSTMSRLPAANPAQAAARAAAASSGRPLATARRKAHSPAKNKRPRVGWDEREVQDDLPNRGRVQALPGGYYLSGAPCIPCKLQRKRCQTRRCRCAAHCPERRERASLPTRWRWPSVRERVCPQRLQSAKELHGLFPQNPRSFLLAVVLLLRPLARGGGRTWWPLTSSPSFPIAA